MYELLEDVAVLGTAREPRDVSAAVIASAFAASGAVGFVGGWFAARMAWPPKPRTITVLAHRSGKFHRTTLPSGAPSWTPIGYAGAPACEVCDGEGGEREDDGDWLECPVCHGTGHGKWVEPITGLPPVETGACPKCGGMGCMLCAGWETR